MVSEEYFLKSFIDEIVRLHKPKAALRALAPRKKTKAYRRTHPY